MFEDIELNAIQEENARELVKRLLNMVEELSRDVRELRVENQRLRDENNRLKGEQGKPDIKGNKAQPSVKADHSSEAERRKKRVRHKKSKKVELRTRNTKDAKRSWCRNCWSKQRTCAFIKRSTTQPRKARRIWQNFHPAMVGSSDRASRA